MSHCGLISKVCFYSMRGIHIPLGFSSISFSWILLVVKIPKSCLKLLFVGWDYLKYAEERKDYFLERLLRKWLEVASSRGFEVG